MAQLTGQVGAQDIPAGVQIILDAEGMLTRPTGDPMKDQGHGAGRTGEELPAGVKAVLDLTGYDTKWSEVRWMVAK